MLLSEIPWEAADLALASSKGIWKRHLLSTSHATKDDEAVENPFNANQPAHPYPIYPIANSTMRQAKWFCYLLLVGAPLRRKFLSFESTFRQLFYCTNNAACAEPPHFRAIPTQRIIWYSHLFYQCATQIAICPWKNIRIAREIRNVAVLIYWYTFLYSWMHKENARSSFY